ncbi:phage tail protein [Anaerococcus porci]|uniref:phage tail tube protein n=1 Tax=Anaerococcus porci TaxID=2652269 RepID=UPI002A747ED3|nr:phage tail protein [Anaerococcus porci]MDY3006029.1 phage tail protein [Anaerococcus porci]
MANTNNTSTGKPKIGGAIFVGYDGVAVPKDAKSELTGFKELGYVSDDGLTNSNSSDSDKIKAWGGDTVLVISKGKEDTLQFKLIEVMNLDVLKYVYGEENVSGTLETGITLKANSKQTKAHTLVIDMVYQGGVMKRIVAPNAIIQEMDDIEYTDEDAVGYAVTVSCLPDTEGNNHYEYILKKGAAE